MLRVYLASPGNQIQADAARHCPVLVSYANLKKFRPIMRWLPSFDRVLLDSGAYSELNSGMEVDIGAYAEWAQSIPWADAWAGLDDIRGDWRRSLKNYKAGGFPTFHDTDPEKLLDDLIPMAQERGGWLGLGLLPPRTKKEDWMLRTLERIPDDIHVHGWACGVYKHLTRLDSMDSTHWWREAMKYRTKMPWLTYGETLEIAVKKMQRIGRMEKEE